MMILNALVLHNVGTFAGTNVIDLTPPSQAKPVVLVGGVNGAGKTTILESIQLVLYGPLSHQGGRRSGSYEKYLRNLIHRRVTTNEGAAIELTFTASQGGSEHSYWVRRSWKSTGASIREILLVSVDGRHNETLTSTWNEHVENFLPRGIAGLFFFDGEQIEALADLERSRQVLSSAVAALLGLDMVERLSTDLTALRRRHRGDQLPDGVRQGIEEKKQLVTAQRQTEEAATEAEAARLTELEMCRKVFDEVTEAFRAAGGHLLEQRETVEARFKAVGAELLRCEDDIRRELAEVAPLLQVGDLLGQLGEQVRTELASKSNRLLIEAFSGRDSALLQMLIDAEVEDPVMKAVEQFLREDRTARQSSISRPEVVGLDDNAEIEGLLSATLPNARERLLAGIARRGELKGESDQAARVLAAIPNPEALADIYEAREEARDAQFRAEAKHALASEMLVAARADRVKAVQEYEAALDQATNANLAADDDRRLVEHVDRVRLTLQRLRVEATRRHLERISQLILEALDNLLRKDKLITDVKIDAETHSVALTGVDGHALSPEDLSAGERQLLAIALLWGLARAAGQPLPVVIDTPLGRLDASHREHLLDRYFPQASHQVVLLSTDTEIDENAFDRISSKVGRSYHLEFDPATNATHVEDGYFWS